MSGGGGGNQNTQTQNLPMPQMAGPYKDYGKQLRGFMGEPGTAFDQYQGQTLASQSPLTQAGIGAMANPAQWNQALDYYGGVAGGDYLGLNPALQNAVINPVIENVNAGFNQMGRYGSGLNAERAGEAGMRALMPYYDAERQRQGQAAGLLPGLQQGAAQAQIGAGGLQEQYGQRNIQEAMNQFGQQNYDPRLAALSAYGGLLSPGSQFNVSTGTQQIPGGSSAAGGLGGAMMGGMMGLPYGPVGLIGGGLLGGLAGSGLA